jgi:hypothetical protein
MIMGFANTAMGSFFVAPVCPWGSSVHSYSKGNTMKWNSVPTVLALALAAGLMSSAANAAGCLKGAAVGGVAGHFAGHHGVLGAGAGCVIGHHEATKHARQQATQNQGSGSSAASNNSQSGAAR